MAILLTALSLAGCASTQTKQIENTGDFELGDEVAPPSGCSILRSQVKKENEKNGTNKESGC
jgi:hypothetical protein